MNALNDVNYTSSANIQGPIEGLAALMNINSESQSGGAGAAIKLELRRKCDGVQMYTCVHITHHSQILGFWVPAQR